MAEKTTYKGLVPPQSVDLEIAVLGACLVDTRAMDELVETISKKEVFYNPSHQMVFDAMWQLYQKKQPIDLLSVSQQLKAMNALDAVGGDFYLIGLSRKVAGSAHLQHHAFLLLQNFMKRSIIGICQQAAKMSYDEASDVFDVLDLLHKNLDAINNSVSAGHSLMSWADAMDKVVERVDFLTQNKGKLIGLPTGLAAVDRMFCGWQKTDFIVIGADNGMGKTAFSMCSILASAAAGRAVGMFSMEMSTLQLAIRAVATQSHFHMNQLMRNGFEKNEYFDGLRSITESMKGLPIHIDDQPALTVLEMKRKARRMKRLHGIELLVIDFVQMFSGDKDIRINISEASRECKNLAKELEIPVIALSQLSREVKKERYKLPGKHHLKESSAIEEAADVIGLLYRPNYYGYTRENDPELFEDLGLLPSENAALIVAKNRNGAMGTIGLHYIENKTKYVDEAPMEGYVEPNYNHVPY